MHGRTLNPLDSGALLNKLTELKLKSLSYEGRQCFRREGRDGGAARRNKGREKRERKQREDRDREKRERDKSNGDDNLKRRNITTCLCLLSASSRYCGTPPKT